TDAISTLLQEQVVNAFRFEGIRYDCGSKEGFLEATVEYALKHPEMEDSMTQYILQLAKKLESK
ncbi:MAG: UTP--glucose-1-phosphate uridylyltransferase, partial [Gammaproteobacteria bacterium]|nr:UTP--glucose-1-phosphate uridylyltransferase [Gammaproteobacteria bacterium]